MPVDSNNSTSTPLGAGATFTGSAFDVGDMSSVSVSYNSDAPGVSAGLKIQFSANGTDWDRTIVITPEADALQANYGGVHMVSVINRYVRVTYENGPTPQTEFRLQTVVGSSRNLPLVSRAHQTIGKSNDVQLVRVVGDYNHDKAHGLFSYLANDAIEATKDDVGSTETTIWQKTGDVSYVFPTTAEPLRIKAGGDVADTAAGAGARTVTIHGLDENWEEADETLVLAGASASASTLTNFFRVNHAEVATSGVYGASNTGDIIIENETSAQEVAIIGAGRGHSEAAVFTVPAGKTMYITRICANVGASNKATLHAYVREDADVLSAPFSAPYVYAQFNELDTVISTIPHTLRVIPEKSDFWITAAKDSGGGKAHASCVIDFDLVDNAI